MKSLLIRSDPWSHQHCGRSKYTLCFQNKEEKGTNCSKRNIVYSSSCNMRKLGGKKSQYLGESRRSLMESNGEHLRNAGDDDKKRKSHIRDHCQLEQGGNLTEFRLRI